MCKAAEKCIDIYFQSFTAAAKKDVSCLSAMYKASGYSGMYLEGLSWEYSPQQMEILPSQARRHQ